MCQGANNDQPSQFPLFVMLMASASMPFLSTNTYMFAHIGNCLNSPASTLNYFLPRRTTRRALPPALPCGFGGAPILKPPAGAGAETPPPNNPPVEEAAGAAWKKQTTINYAVRR